MDAGCVGCVSLNDPPHTGESRCRLQRPRPARRVRPAASAEVPTPSRVCAQSVGELFPKRVFASLPGVSLPPRSAGSSERSGWAGGAAGPPGVAQCPSGPFLPQVPGRPVETAKHVCFCYPTGKTTKKQKPMPKSTSLPSPTANAPDAPCFLPKSQTWSLCSAPLGANCSQGTCPSSAYWVRAELWGISARRWCVPSGSQCSGSYL